MTDIKITDSQDNIGGLACIQFIPVEDVLSIPQAVGLSLQGDVVLKDGKRWFICNATPETTGMDMPTEKTNHGDKWNVTIVGLIPALTAAIEANLVEMQPRLYLVKVKTNNGKWRLCGTLDGPMDFLTTPGTGTATADMSGTNIQWTTQMAHAPYYLS